jgi:hypothetical protein
METCRFFALRFIRGNVLCHTSINVFAKCGHAHAGVCAIRKVLVDADMIPASLAVHLTFVSLSFIFSLHCTTPIRLSPLTSICHLFSTIKPHDRLMALPHVLFVLCFRLAYRFVLFSLSSPPHPFVFSFILRAPFYLTDCVSSFVLKRPRPWLLKCNNFPSHFPNSRALQEDFSLSPLRSLSLPL